MQHTLIIPVLMWLGVSMAMNGQTPATNTAPKSGASESPSRTEKTVVPREIPKTWDDAAMASLELPLANPIGSPKHVSADYYYKIPVRPIYKSYPWYSPGRQPSGYVDWLRQQEPEIVWGVDKNGQEHKPPLVTEADLIKAGQLVFEAPIAWLSPLPDQFFDRPLPIDIRATKDGIIPFDPLVVLEKGKIQMGVSSCAECHTRVMPDGTFIQGAQGNFPADQAAWFSTSARGLAFLRNQLRSLFAAPWLRPDPQAALQEMSMEEIRALHFGTPPGVMARVGSSAFCPVHVPDLIDLKERKYLDSTGLQQHQSIVDLMRYAALNQGGLLLASYDGFIPAGAPDFKSLPDPNTRTRYSDEQLYALALFLYSLQPPLNPNKLDAVAVRGQKIFEREGCATCHTPPLYTNNKLTPAKGFKIPEDHLKKYDILPVSIGTDPNLTMTTRRGTGYYKVPSLRGVWYRSMFEHSGSVATLEDWFDPHRLRNDYVPTGFKGYGVKTRAVEGHEFGLKLSDPDKTALIAFLKTL
jgi:hypothetical protein